MQVGDTLFFVPTGQSRIFTPRTVTVTQVGRKWALIGRRLRVDIKTMQCDGRGYASPGKCYPNEEAYRAEQELFNAWKGLADWLRNRYSPPEGITLETIQQVKGLLGV